MAKLSRNEFEKIKRLLTFLEDFKNVNEISDDVKKEVVGIINLNINNILKDGCIHPFIITKTLNDGIEPHKNKETTYTIKQCINCRNSSQYSLRRKRVNLPDKNVIKTDNKTLYKLIAEYNKQLLDYILNNEYDDFNEYTIRENVLKMYNMKSICR